MTAAEWASLSIVILGWQFFRFVMRLASSRDRFHVSETWRREWARKASDDGPEVLIE